MPQLIFYVKGDYPQIYDLVEDTLSIGRSPGVAIRLADSCVSSVHAELKKKEDGSYQLKDLESSNGTVVNGIPVTSTDLHHGDQIKFGTVKAAFIDRGKNVSISAPNKGEKQALKTANGGADDRTASIEIPGSSGGKAMEKMKEEAAALTRKNEEALLQLESVKDELAKSRRKQIELQSICTAREEELAQLKKSREALEGARLQAGAVKVVSLKERDSIRSDLKKQRAELEEVNGKIAEHEKQVAQARAELGKVESELSARLKEVEEKAARLRQVKEEIESTNAKRESIQAQVQGFEKRREQLEADLEERKRALVELIGSIEEKERVLEEIVAKVRESEDRIESSAEELASRRDEMAAVGRELEVRRAELEEKAGERRLLEEEIVAKRGERDELAAKISDHEAQFLSCNEKLAVAGTQLEKCLGEVGEKSRQLAELQEQIESATRARESAEAEFAGIEARREELESERSAAQQALDDLTRSIEEKRAEAEELSRRAGETEERIRAAESNLSSLQSEHGRIEGEISRWQEEQRALQERCDALHRDIEEKSATLQGLEESIATTSQNREAVEAEAREIEARREGLAGELAKKERALGDLEKAIEEKQRLADDLAETARKEEARAEEARAALGTIESDREKCLREIEETRREEGGLREKCGSLSKLIVERTAFLGGIEDVIRMRKEGGDEVACPPLRVIYPGLRSLVHFFYQGAGDPAQGRVMPIGPCGLAACTRGSVHREADSVPPGEDPILVQLGTDLGQNRELLETVADEIGDRPVLACWHDGLPAEILRDGGSTGDLLRGLSGLIAVDPATAARLRECGGGLPVLETALPCPLEIPEWNLATPPDQRPGDVFVMIDGFDPESDRHRQRFDFLERLVAECDARFTLWGAFPEETVELKIPEERVSRIDTSIGYGEYLGEVARHKVVTGFGRNPAGGDLVGDALLTGTAFCGGERTVVLEDLLFPDGCLEGGDSDGAVRGVTRLLTDPAALGETADRARELAMQHLSFDAVQKKVAGLVASLKG